MIWRILRLLVWICTRRMFPPILSPIQEWRAGPRLRPALIMGSLIWNRCRRRIWWGRSMCWMPSWRRSSGLTRCWSRRIRASIGRPIWARKWRGTIGRMSSKMRCSCCRNRKRQWRPKLRSWISWYFSTRRGIRNGNSRCSTRNRSFCSRGSCLSRKSANMRRSWTIITIAGLESRSLKTSKGKSCSSRRFSSWDWLIRTTFSRFGSKLKLSRNNTLQRKKKAKWKLAIWKIVWTGKARNWLIRVSKFRKKSKVKILIRKNCI